jgi:hypothetical protein
LVGSCGPSGIRFPQARPGEPFAIGQQGFAFRQADRVARPIDENAGPVGDVSETFFVRHHWTSFGGTEEAPPLCPKQAPS